MFASHAYIISCTSFRSYTYFRPYTSFRSYFLNTLLPQIIMFVSRAYFISHSLNTVLLMRTSAKAHARKFRVCIRISIRVINNENAYSHNDEPVFEEMVDGKTLNPINTYIVLPPPLTLAITPTKVLKKKRKIRGRTIIATIKRAQSDKTASTCFLSTALHSVSQAITCEKTNKIAIYNNKVTACCAY